MSEFNMEFERARLKVIDARKAVEAAMKRYDEVVIEFISKFPKAVVPRCNFD